MTAIESALRGAQRAFNASGGHTRDALGEPVVENMLVAYGFVATLAEQGVDPLSMGHARHLLELNALVLCGTDPERRARYADHLAATERRFYEEPGAGVGDLVETMALNAGDDAFERAAAAYMRMLGRPQLFIEGNHRTGALVIASVLLLAARPPFVLTASNADAYFTASSAFRNLEKNGLGALLRAAGLRRDFARMLRAEVRPEYLHHA